jgi:cell wall-associated NlpC family hydrolase
LLLVGSVLIALSGTELYVSPNGSQSEQQTGQTAQMGGLLPASAWPDQAAAEGPVPEPAQDSVDAPTHEPSAADEDDDTAEDDTAEDDTAEDDTADEDDTDEDDNVSGEAGDADADESSETTPEEDAATPVADETAVYRPRPTPQGAGAAVDYALGQVGKPYVWGGAGPHGFDCSGLVMKAWQAGGVDLPHHAADQWRYGPPISRDDLRAGDLVFLYSLGHVQLYTGNGLVVHAPQPGSTVGVVSLPIQGIDGYRRLTAPDTDANIDDDTFVSDSRS